MCCRKPGHVLADCPSTWHNQKKPTDSSNRMILSPDKDFTSYVLVNKEKVLASLDSGAWISTCSPVFAESRNLVLKKIEPFHVFVADGTKVVVDLKVDVKLQITTQGPQKGIHLCFEGTTRVVKHRYSRVEWIFLDLWRSPSSNIPGNTRLFMQVLQWRLFSTLHQNSLLGCYRTGEKQR